MNTHLTKNTRLQFINTTALPPDENSTISKEIMLFEVPESLATIIESNLYQ
jgi:hypothetical protein